MLVEHGEEVLTAFYEQHAKEAFDEICSGVWLARNYGHSNAICIEAEHSVILVDTLDTYERAMCLKSRIAQCLKKPVKTIIYTHGHPDHIGGAKAFLDEHPEIIACSPTIPLAKAERLADIQRVRGERQFGYTLSDAENITQGIGRREGTVYGEHRAFHKATTYITEDKVERRIDGLTIELAKTPGEAADSLLVWLPKQRVLCCGDTYYGCFPNLYAIRGGEYRDIDTWIKSLDRLLSYPASYLLPGHLEPLAHEEIKEVLQNVRDAFTYIIDKTLAGMNEGKGMDELAQDIQLPEHYANLPYMQEHYGCVEWSVREIYTAYLGWFDGNPTKLHPMRPNVKAKKMIAMMKGSDTLCQEIQRAIEEKEYTWCLELCDLLLDAQQCVKMATEWKADALCELAKQETSANGRHYYLSYAKELRKMNQ